MVATQPQTHNRIGAHFDLPPAKLPELPKSARERGQLWSDTVFQAVLTLKMQLTSRDPAVAVAAANSILDLEGTRMRHDQQIAGSEEISEEQAEFEDQYKLEPLGELDPLPMPKPAAPKKSQLPTKPVTRNDEPEIFRQHAQEAYDEKAKLEARKPEEQRHKLTMELAYHFVEKQLNLYELKASDIPPGEFVETINDLYRNEERRFQ